MKTIGFQDFLPKQLEATKWMGIAYDFKYETIVEAVAAANEWIASHQVTVINVETVAIPGLRGSMNEGPTDAAINPTDSLGLWYQFVRVWYEYEA